MECKLAFLKVQNLKVRMSGVLLCMFLKWLSCVYHCVGHPRGQQSSPWHRRVFFFSDIKALISCPFISQGNVICTRVARTFWKNKRKSMAVPTLTGALSMVWMLMFLQSSYAESLMPHVMVWGGGALGGAEVLRVELSWMESMLLEETP